MATSESQSLTDTSTVNEQVQDTLMEENPIPCLPTQTSLPVSSKAGKLMKCKGRRARKEMSGGSLVTKRIQTRSGGRKLVTDVGVYVFVWGEGSVCGGGVAGSGGVMCVRMQRSIS